jgi:hypothetical protein
MLNENIFQLLRPVTLCKLKREGRNVAARILSSVASISALIFPCLRFVAVDAIV